MTRLILGLAMLISSDITAASNSGLRPGAIAAVKSVAAIRAATVETLTFANYPASTQSTIITHTFDANSLTTGNQVRFFIWGQINNTSGTPKSFSPSVYVTQNAAIQSAAFLYTAPAGLSEFVLDGAVSFSVPGPAQIGGPTSMRQQSLSNGTVLAAGSLIRLANRTGVGAVAQDFAVVSDPNSLLIDGFSPVGISVTSTTAALTTFNVLGGWMEAL